LRHIRRTADIPELSLFNSYALIIKNFNDQIDRLKEKVTNNEEMTCYLYCDAQEYFSQLYPAYCMNRIYQE